MDYVCVPGKKCDQKSSWVEARGAGDTLGGNSATDPSNSNENHPRTCPRNPDLLKKSKTDSTCLGGHNPIFRVASIDADNIVLFQNSSYTDEIKLPVRVKWSLDDQEVQTKKFLSWLMAKEEKTRKPRVAPSEAYKPGIRPPKPNKDSTGQNLDETS
ncbi:hypothetical protein B0H13DRAFT_1850767 [Mycena leptocephala]|nr:hypothetical protein B0H13DRAFT_1850767 [Mycena leptocephala]